MIKAIIFDLDDTLLNEVDYIKSGYKAVSRHISQKFNLNEKDIFESMIEFSKISYENVFDRILYKYEINNTDIITELVSIYRNHVPDITLDKSTIDLIHLLKSQNYKLGIITDGYKETQNNKIKKLSLSKLFDHIIVTDEIGRDFWKPSKVPFVMMAEKLNVNLNEMVYIGDNEKKDFLAGNELGMLTIKLENKFKIHDFKSKETAYLPQKTITCLSDILFILDEKSNYL